MVTWIAVSSLSLLVMCSVRASVKMWLRRQVRTLQAEQRLQLRDLERRIALIESKFPDFIYSLDKETHTRALSIRTKIGCLKQSIASIETRADQSSISDLRSYLHQGSGGYGDSFKKETTNLDNQVLLLGRKILQAFDVCRRTGFCWGESERPTLSILQQAGIC